MPDPILDPTALENLLAIAGGDQAFVAELIDTFLVDSPKLIAAMRRALDSNNAEELSRAAHTLKSNSTNFGATRLTSMAKELEEKGKVGTLANGAAKVAQIESEYDRVRGALQEARISR